jgi:hypothetical protein
VPQPAPAPPARTNTPWNEPTMAGVTAPRRAQGAGDDFIGGVQLPDGTHRPKVEPLSHLEYESKGPLDPTKKGMNEAIIIEGPGDRPGEKKLWVFKPSSGEEPMLFGPDVGIEHGDRWRRAAAAAHLAAEMGFDTPGVRLVEINGRVGSLQEFRSGYETAKSLYDSDRTGIVDFYRSQQRLDIDAFDYFIAHQDRHLGNIMLPADQGQMTRKAGPLLIDQDSAVPGGFDRSVVARDPNLTNPNTNKPVDRTGYIRDIPGTISQPLADRFQQLHANFPEATLRQWLTQAEVDGLRDRLTVLVRMINEQKIAVVP